MVSLETDNSALVPYSLTEWFPPSMFFAHQTLKIMFSLFLIVPYIFGVGTHAYASADHFKLQISNSVTKAVNNLHPKLSYSNFTY
jgi:hypothetical protein